MSGVYVHVQSKLRSLSLTRTERSVSKEALRFVPEARALRNCRVFNYAIGDKIITYRFLCFGKLFCFFKEALQHKIPGGIYYCSVLEAMNKSVKVTVFLSVLPEN